MQIAAIIAPELRGEGRGGLQYVIQYPYPQQHSKELQTQTAMYIHLTIREKTESKDINRDRQRVYLTHVI